MLGAAQATEQVGTKSVVAAGEASQMGGALAKIGEIGKSAIGSFIGFTGAQAAIAGFTAAFSDIRREIIGFDDALTSAVALWGGVSSQMKTQLGDTARQVAIQWGESATEVVGVYRQLADEGLTAQQAIAVLPQSVAFARASLLPLNDAADTVVKLQAAFRLQSADPTQNAQMFAHVTDVITTAAKLSVATVGDLSTAMAKAGPIGAALGMSIEDVAGTLATLADRGYSGRRALLAFTQLFEELPAKASSLSDIGIQIFDSAGKLLPAGSIIDAFTNKLKGMSAQQEIATLTNAGLSVATQKVIFGLLGAGDAVRTMDAQLAHASGTTDDIANRAMASVANRLAQVKAVAIDLVHQGIAEFSTFVSYLNDQLGPSLAKIGQVVVDVARFFAPLAELLGGSAFKAGEVTIEAIGAALSVLADFLTKHEKLVELVAAAYTVKLVVSLAQALAGFIALKAEAIGEMFDRAATSAYDFAYQLELNATAAGKLKFALAGIGSVIALVAAAGAVVGLTQAFSGSTSEAKKLVDTLTTKPTSNNDIFQSWDKSVTDLSTQLDIVNKKRGDLVSAKGLETGGIGTTLIGGADAVLTGLGFGGVIKGSLLDLTSDSVALQKQIDKLNEQKAALHDALSSIRDEVYGQTPLDPVIRQQQGLTPAVMSQSQIFAVYGTQEQQIRTLDALATKLGIDLTQPVSQWQGQLTQAARSLVGLSPAGQEAATALQAVDTAASTGTDQISALDTAIKALLDTAFGSDDALDKVRGDLLDVTANSEKAAAGGGKLRVAFNENTKEGLAFSASLRTSIGDIAEAGLSVLSTTGDVKKATDTVAVLRQGFIDTATAAGVPQAEILQLVAVLDQITSKTLTPKVDTSKVDAAKGKTTDVKTGLDELGKIVAKPTVDANTQPFTTKIAGVQSALDKLNGTKVVVTPGANAPRGSNPGGSGPTETYNPNANGNANGSIYFANGEVVRYLAGSSGSEDHVAQIAKAGEMRVWAEPETGGEAYVPLSPSKRGRSEAILGTVAELFGMRVTKHADGSVDAPDYVPPDAGTLQFFRTIARAQIDVLNAAFGDIGKGTHIEFVTDAQMRHEYAGSKLYGNASGTGDASANGNPNNGAIQLNEDLLLYSGFRDPVKVAQQLITKEYAQTVLPKLLSSDSQIARYFDVIGYHPRTDAHLVDDLNYGQVAIGFETTTPADAFGFFVAQALHEDPSWTPVPAKMVADLVKAGLIPAPADVIDELAMLAKLAPTASHDPAAFGEAVQGILASLHERATAKKLTAMHVNPGTTASAGITGGSYSLPAGTPSWTPAPKIHAYAAGGVDESHARTAQVSSSTGSTVRVWAEPETGGEAYVPLAPGKRAQSTKILDYVATQFGYRLIPKDAQHFDAGGVITDERNYQGQIGYNQFAQRNTASFAATAFIAAAGVQAPDLSSMSSAADRAKALTDFQIAQQKAVQDALQQTSTTYTDVAAAAGKSAADQLAASGLVGQAFDDAAQKIIAEAQTEKATRAQLVDESYSSGHLSTTAYLADLNKRLAGTKKYSSEWLAVHEQIESVHADQLATQQQLESDAYAHGEITSAKYLADLNKQLDGLVKFSKAWLAVHEQIVQVQDQVQQQQQSVADSITQPFSQSTDVVQRLGGQAGVTGSTISGFLSQSVTASQTFNSLIAQLTKKGFDKGLISEIVKAGPADVPFAQQLLTLDPKTVNAQLGQIAGQGVALTHAGLALGTTTTTVTIGNISFDVSGLGVDQLTPAILREIVGTSVGTIAVKIKQGTKG